MNATSIQRHGVILAAMLLVAGCGRSPSLNSPRLDSQEVERVAGVAAAQEGFDLAKYQSPTMQFDDDGRWTIFFEQNPPTPAGGHFLVRVEDATGKATVMPGE